MKLRREGSTQLGVGLRQKRKESGKTLTEMARATGISQSYLSRIERGDVTNPTIETVFRVLDALSEDLLLQGTRVAPRSTALVYRSPFTLEELASMDEEYSGQPVVRLVQETLKSPDIPVEQRRFLGKQIDGLVTGLRGAIAWKELGHAR
jgi:transcriptional regulator with XRE-family HTH domain